jgi:hypothetical protein
MSDREKEVEVESMEAKSEKPSRDQKKPREIGTGETSG